MFSDELVNDKFISEYQDPDDLGDDEATNRGQYMFNRKTHLYNPPDDNQLKHVAPTSVHSEPKSMLREPDAITVGN